MNAMIYHIVCLLTLILVSPVSVLAQTDEQQVREVIARLFKGMQLGDSAMVHSTFDHSVTMATAFRNKDNAPVLRKEYSSKNFLDAVGTPHTEAWNEEIWDLSVTIDADMAAAWCPFAFYRGKTFSHCGVNAFHLFKTKEGWKIFHLADTRRTTGCTIPESVSSKYTAR
jgi:hypothetical protein